MAVHQNVLQGDGVQPYLGATCGVSMEGMNVVVDENDISNLTQGVHLWSDGPGTINANAFNMYSNNSFYNVGDPFSLSAAWNGNPETSDSSWFLGNVFRDNIANTVPVLAADYYSGSFLSIVGYAAGVDSSGHAEQPNETQVLMNVVDGNIVTGTGAGISFFSTTPYHGDAGIAETVITNNFFSSNGEIYATEVSVNQTTDGIDYDVDPYALGANNIWQGFDIIKG